MFFAFTSGFLGWFNNCVSLLERADRIGVIGRESRYVGPVNIALRKYSGYMNRWANECPFRANNAPFALIFHFVFVGVHKEDFGHLELS